MLFIMAIGTGISEPTFFLIISDLFLKINRCQDLALCFINLMPKKFEASDSFILILKAILQLNTMSQNKDILHPFA